MGGRALAIDLGLVALLSLLICFFARDPAVMGPAVGAAFVVRLGLWSRLTASERDLALPRELAFLGLCTLLGAFNDWNTVVRKGVYAYTVPAELPELSSIPLWMLAFWGIILRLLSSLPRWRRLEIPPPPGGPVLPRLAIMGLLVLGTRLAIYRYYEHPWLSWLPFAAALLLAVLLLRPDARRLLAALFVAVAGVGVEALYVQVAGLHAYGLGWIAGVPLWIALWWALAALLWGELSARIVLVLRG
jgi:hypothetical protein